MTLALVGSTAVAVAGDGDGGRLTVVQVVAASSLRNRPVWVRTKTEPPAGVNSRSAGAGPTSSQSSTSLQAPFGATCQRCQSGTGLGGVVGSAKISSRPSAF